MNENCSSSSISWTGTKQRVGLGGATKPAILHTVREINEIGFRSIRKEPKRGHIGTFRWWLDSFSINESLVRIPTKVGSRKGRQTGRKYGRAGGLDCLRSTFSIEAEAPYSDCKKGIQSMSMG